jgi:hypothetical protein
MATNTSLSSICAQRKKNMLFTVPPPRNTILDKSPYPAYTSSQLNMRRKAEILKYSGTVQNTKTNNPTKKQLYSQIMQGRNGVRSTPNNTENNNQCPTTTIIYTPSGASGVPGPSVDLYLDNSIPLYNYATNTTSEGIGENANTNKWLIHYADENTYVNDNDMNLLFSINITDIIDEYKYTYYVSVPIGFKISGSKKPTDNKVSTYNNLSLKLDPTFNTPIEFIVNYNDDNVKVISDPIISYSSNENITDISFNIDDNAPTFTATLYTGILTISNIDLYTEAGYIYDVYIKPHMNIVIGDNTLTSAFELDYDVSYGLLLNLSEGVTSDVSNCEIITESSNKVYTPISVTSM